MTEFIIDKVEFNRNVLAYRYDARHQTGCEYGMKPFIEIEACCSIRAFRIRRTTWWKVWKTRNRSVKDRIKSYTKPEYEEAIKKELDSVLCTRHIYCDSDTDPRMVKVELLEGEELEHYKKACEREIKRFYDGAMLLAIEC